MSRFRVKDGSYIAIQSFMVKDLKLKGNELLVYGIIYGFSKEGKAFKGSLKYLQSWCGCARNTILNTLKSLMEKGYITKKEVIKNNLKYCEYKTTSRFKPVKKTTENTPKESTNQTLTTELFNPFESPF